MNIDKLLEELYSYSAFNIKLGLDNITKLCEKMGNPQNEYKIIHVAGTNGKGSTSTTIEKVLIEAGYRVGKYTSPHILKFNERISFNGVDISDEDIAKYYYMLKNLIEEHNIKPTFFELTTAMMFAYFRDMKPDYVILETGMGGRYDATNVCNSEISIITNVSLDHTEYLGDTIYKISKEKAGIIKPNSYVIVGDDNAEFLKAISEKTEKYINICEKYKDVKFNLNFNNFMTEIFVDNKKYDFSLFGNYQVKNFLCAYEALKYIGIEENIMKEAFKKVVWQCRFEVFSKNPLVIFDGAHNSDGIDQLCSIIKSNFDKEEVCILVSILKDKDVRAMISELKNVTNSLIVTSIPDNPRGSSAKYIYDLIDDKNGIDCVEDPLDAYNYMKSKNKKINICCGSFYILIKLKEVLNEKK